MSAFEPPYAGLWLGGLLLWVLLSVAWRRSRGHPVFARQRPGAVYSERWASARVGSGLLARLGTARNCMHVQVTGTELRLHPHFPFTLGFMPELYGLDLVVPLERVRSATILGGRHAQAVEVLFRTAEGGEQTLQLLLRKAEAFIAAAGPRPV